MASHTCDCLSPIDHDLHSADVTLAVEEHEHEEGQSVLCEGVCDSLAVEHVYLHPHQHLRV